MDQLTDKYTIIQRDTDRQRPGERQKKRDRMTSGEEGGRQSEEELTAGEKRVVKFEGMK